MRLPAPRTKTPVVEPVEAEENTEPELAPPMKEAPVVAKGESKPAHKAEAKPDTKSKKNDGKQDKSADAVRSRKPTLVSPIPALLAAQMGQVREEKNDGTPTAVDRRGEQTSRFQIPEDDDYVVEVDPHKS